MTAATAGARGARAVRADQDLPLLALSEVALGAVTVAAMFGLRRAFLGSEWFWPLALQAVAAHGLAAALRRRGVPTAGAFAALVGAGFLAVTWIHAGDTTAFGLPTGASWEMLRDAVNLAATEFSEVKAPTEALPGFLIATSAAVWLGAAVADWAAFRAGAVIEATLPSASVFAVASIFGADHDRVLASAVWLAPVLAYVLFRRADTIGRRATWVGERKRTGPRAMVLLGLGLVAVAVLAGALGGNRLPGAQSGGVISLRDLGDDGPGTRLTVSPLVDIRSRLVDQADVEVFTVRSNVRAYWRLTSLDRFDGRLWSSNGSYGSADGDLDDGVDVAADRIEFEQSFAISALSQIWLPAAYEPQTITAGQDVRYDEVSGTLIVDTDIPTSDDTDYRVVSALPQHDPDALATASTQVPADIADLYLDLPSDFSPSVRQLAEEVTQGATSRYAAARQLQDWFRSEFTYDLDTPDGHGESAIEQFLFDTRTGYCEQFAGSFAAMARTLGIPARVAVGFTSGETSGADPTLYRVSGKYAHAWPEVFLGEYGWVSFEPTPGRGAPFAEQYTGVPEQQVSADGDPTTATTAVSPPSSQPSDSPDVPATRPLGEDLAGPELDPVGTGDDSPNPWPGRALWTVAGLAAVVVLYVLTVVAVTALRRARRRRNATEPPAQVALAWDDALAAVGRAGIAVPAAETPNEVASRIGARLPSLVDPARTLAITVQDTTFSAIGPSEELAARALALAGRIEAGTRASMTRSERVRARFHPRRLVG